MSLSILKGLIFPILFCGCSLTPPLITDQPRSLKQLRFEYTVSQKSDFTCGAASLATLVTFFLNRPITEYQVLDVLSGRYSKQEMRDKSRSGLSFDDLVFVSERLGFLAQGAEISLPGLNLLAGPVIVQLNKGKLQHFVVLRRAGDGVMYLSDPAVGKVSMSVDDFRKQFTGFVLAVWAKGDKLPIVSAFQNPQDGLSVNNSLARVINAPLIPAQPKL